MCASTLQHRITFPLILRTNIISQMLSTGRNEAVILSNYTLTGMWANSQRDGRPAEYRRRPLFNAAKFGWRPLLQCRAVTLPRRETRWNLLGCPKLPQRISAVSGPKFTILWGHVGEILLFNNFSPIFDTCLSCEDIARQSCAMVPRWRFLAIFLLLVFLSVPCAAHFRPAF